jgi:hypothetical protein
MKLAHTNVKIGAIDQNLLAHPVPAISERPEVAMMADGIQELPLQIARVPPKKNSVSGCNVLLPDIETSLEVCTLNSQGLLNQLADVDSCSVAVFPILAHECDDTDPVPYQKAIRLTYFLLNEGEKEKIGKPSQFSIQLKN